MKKISALLIMLALSFILVACGETESQTSGSEGAEETADESLETEQASEESATEETNETSEEADEENSSEVSQEQTIEGLGHTKVVGIGYNDEIGIDGSDDPLKPLEMDPMELTIKNLTVLEIEPDEDAKQLYFENKDKVKAVVIDMKVENTSENDVTFDPNMSTLVTDTGEQVESDMFLMGESGGDFLGQVIKEDQTWWILENFEEEVSSINMIISPPYNTDSWEDIGEEKRLEFEVLNWEEAKEKDGLE